MPAGEYMTAKTGKELTQGDSSVEKNGDSLVESRGSGRQRVQLDFSPDAYRRLEQIRELAGASTNAAVVRNALRLYEWFLEQKKNNYRFQLVKDHTVKEVELLL